MVAMAHSCPTCDEVCYCNGDIDDVLLDDEDAIAGCTHCNEDGSEDEFPEDEPTCRVCGCTNFSPCVDGYVTCSWAEPDLCSFCAQKAEPLIAVYSEAQASAFIRTMRAGA
jgi:hypothetical protein